MIFTPTSLRGVFLVEPELLKDERGFFARTFCQDEFRKHGLEWQWEQCSISFNERAGTLRGMHYQSPPFAETKVVRCTKGAIYDVVLDLRAGSPSEGSWQAFELTEENRKMLYVPEDCAHGFQTLSDKTEVFYEISRMYSAEHSHGIRWNDPAYQIDWPLPAPILSQRDSNFPLRGAK